MNAVSELDSRVALITGASRGVGAATARELAAQGVAVVLAARSGDAVRLLAEEIEQDGGRARGVACDVSRYDDVEGAVTTCCEAFGGIDILVNNAGVIEPIARLSESDPTAWGRAFDINARGIYHGLRAAIPFMERQGSGVIVNISSGAATGVLEGWSHYCASKAAALSLTRCAHKEVADKGVRVVGLSPGTVATEMQAQIKASGINPVSQLDPSVHIPSDWVARAIAWLCTDDARSHDGSDVSLRDEAIRQHIGLTT